jgi:hypothetical protein
MTLRLPRFLLLLALSGVAQAAPICRVGEVAHFRCSFSGQTAVLCGASDPGTGSKELQYRVYKGSRNVMQYPEPQQLAGSQFRQSSVLLAHGGEVRVSFDVSDYRYVLYETWDTHSPSYGGIYVLRKGRLVRQFQCDDNVDPQASLLESSIRKSLPKEEFVDFPALQAAQ